jgi:hypothetical protein
MIALLHEKQDPLVEESFPNFFDVAPAHECLIRPVILLCKSLA